MAKEEKSGNSLLEWLLEPNDIGVRYLALRDLVKTDTAGLVFADVPGV